MRSAPWLIAAVVALAVGLGALLSALMVRRAGRRMPQDLPGRVDALARLRRRRAWTAFGVLLLPQPLCRVLAPEGSLPVLLGTAVAFDLLTAGPVLALHARLRGGGWSHALAAAQHRWSLGPTLVVPALAASGTWAATLGAPQASAAALLGHAAGILLGLLYARLTFARLGHVGDAPAHLEARLAACLGAPAPQVRVLRTEGTGLWNAWALGGRLPRILVAEDLLALLPPAEVEAILCHETGHLRLGHLGVRMLWLQVCWLLLPLGLAWAGLLTPATSGLSALAYVALLAVFAPGQEREADAFAARYAPAPTLGSALVALTRAQLLPTDRPVAFSHPAIRDRLAALGLNPAALLEGAVSPPTLPPAPSA